MANIKTAISMHEALFVKVETIARELKIPRSQVFTLAVTEYVQRQENQQLLARMNAAYKDEPDADEKKRLRQMQKSQRRLVEGEW
jgi:metal-responsive CopG/Arc/MetJ family transcriptional regulator